MLANRPISEKRMNVYGNEQINYAISSAEDETDRHVCSQNFLEYTKNTSIHGLKYVGDLQLNLFQRLFWVLSFLSAIAGACYFISNVFIRYRDMPVMLTLASSSVPMTNIPFPAVTICNMNNVMLKEVIEVDNFGSHFEKDIISDMCSLGKPQSSLTNKKAEPTISWPTMKRIISKVSQNCSDMILYCKWGYRIINCTELFDTVYMDEGSCCIFNKVKDDFIFNNPKFMYDPDDVYDAFESVDWSPENGFPVNSRNMYKPWRPLGSGTTNGLSLILDAELDQHYCSTENSVGFKIFFHNPIEMPRISSYATIIMPGMETRLVIHPEITQASSDLHSISVSKRKCYFNDERKLQFYRTYTQANCVRECTSNFTLAHCECLLYYMTMDNNTKICKRLNDPCPKNATSIMEKVQRKLMADPNSDPLKKYPHLRNKNVGACNCLPGCFEFAYHDTQSQSILSVPELTSQLNEINLIKDFNESYIKKNFASLSIFLQKTEFSATERGVVFGFTDLVSNTGGLLGLFLGFSILSAVEIAYYLTMRIWSHNKSTDKSKTVTDELNRQRIMDKIFKNSQLNGTSLPFIN